MHLAASLAMVALAAAGAGGQAGPDICFEGMKDVEVSVTKASTPRSTTDIFEVSRGNEPIVEIAVTNIEDTQRPSILTPFTEELTSLKPGSRKAIIYDLGDNTSIPLSHQFTIMNLTSDHPKIDVFIVKSPSSTNKVVTVFEPDTRNNYTKIIKDIPIYNVEEYASTDQIPKNGHPLFVIAPKGATVVAKMCAARAAVKKASIALYDSNKQPLRLPEVNNMKEGTQVFILCDGNDVDTSYDGNAVNAEARKKWTKALLVKGTDPEAEYTVDPAGSAKAYIPFQLVSNKITNIRCRLQVASIFAPDKDSAWSDQLKIPQAKAAEKKASISLLDSNKQPLQLPEVSNMIEGTQVFILCDGKDVDTSYDGNAVNADARKKWTIVLRKKGTDPETEHTVDPAGSAKAYIPFKLVSDKITNIQCRLQVASIFAPDTDSAWSDGLMIPQAIAAEKKASISLFDSNKQPLGLPEVNNMKEGTQVFILCDGKGVEKSPGGSLVNADARKKWTKAILQKGTDPETIHTVDPAGSAKAYIPFQLVSNKITNIRCRLQVASIFAPDTDSAFSDALTIPRAIAAEKKASISLFDSNKQPLGLPEVNNMIEGTQVFIFCDGKGVEKFPGGSLVNAEARKKWTKAILQKGTDPETEYTVDPAGSAKAYIPFQLVSDKITNIRCRLQVASIFAPDTDSAWSDGLIIPQAKLCVKRRIVEETKQSLLKLIDGLKITGPYCGVETLKEKRLAEKINQLKADDLRNKKKLNESRANFTRLTKEADELKKANVIDTKELSDLKASVDELTNESKKHIFFSAGFSQGDTWVANRYVTYLSNDVTLKFNKIITNAGNAYNNANGIFTAPFPGYYEFTVSLVTPYGKSDDACAFLRKNGVNVALLLTENVAGTYQGTTINAVVQLKQGDTVDVVPNTNIPGNSRKIEVLATNVPASLFSGKLLSLF